MEILKHGKKSPPTRRFVCSGCSCEFVANIFETVTIPDREWSQVLCPECDYGSKWIDGEPWKEDV